MWIPSHDLAVADDQGQVILIKITSWVNCQKALIILENGFQDGKTVSIFCLMIIL